MIEIVDYQPRWPAEFGRIEADLRAILGEVAERVDHVGSTAVPGLVAKDRIDVQVGVRDLAAAPEIAERLTSRGYRQPWDVAYDHVPGSSPPTDPAEWAKLFFQTPAGAEPAGNIHVREVGRANWRYALLFRDFLRQTPAAAEAYGELKRRLAEHVNDIEIYTDIKDPAVDLVMVAAEAWAAATGWQSTGERPTG